MRYVALITDYDGTAALHGRVDDATLRALEQVRASGRRLVMVTGRLIDDLIRVCPQVDLFDRIVAENGAVNYDPRTRAMHALGERPPSEFIQELRRRGVTPLSSGHVIVSTWHPQETTVLEVIRELQLELQVVFNKGAVMVLPTGINKATGLRAALAELGLSLHNTVGIGDAENDQAFLAACECSVAVANALDSVKNRVDLVTEGDHGAGVIELVDRLVKDDLRSLGSRLSRHEVPIGQTISGDEVRLSPFGRAILVAGPSGAGKTVVTTTFLERLAAAGYQYCVVDPEGDYEGLSDTIAVDGPEPRALIGAVLEILAGPDQRVSVSLSDLRLEERPAFFGALLLRLQELRATTGRPHWIIVDEAHHLMPSEWEPARTALPGLGEAWLLSEGAPAVLFNVLAPASDRRRHRRKYAKGELGTDKSFYFRGPDERLNLRAQNLSTFAQLADGVDDETWTHHLRRHDYSKWFREAIKDPVLADETATIEGQEDLSAADSRARILAAVRQRYTAPA